MSCHCNKLIFLKCFCVLLVHTIMNALVKLREFHFSVTNTLTVKNIVN